MLKRFFLDNVLKIIKKNYPHYNELELEKIEYGLEGIYLTITKLIIIFIFGFILNINKEILLLMLFYSLIRAFAYGLHASKSWICLLSSIIFFIGIPLILKSIYISWSIKVVLYLYFIIIFILYAPADTKKRPIISIYKRRRLKFISVLITIVFILMSIIFNNMILSNFIISALLIESFLVLPITYRIFNQTYNNYRNYNFSIK